MNIYFRRTYQSSPLWCEIVRPNRIAADDLVRPRGLVAELLDDVLERGVSARRMRQVLIMEHIDYGSVADLEWLIPANGQILVKRGEYRDDFQGRQGAGVEEKGGGLDGGEEAAQV